jgi:hypothetical protein
MISLQTPLFRIALTVAGIWVAFSAYQGWRAREAVTSYTYRDGYSTETEACAEITELAPGPSLTFVSKPNPDHIACLERVNQTYAGYEMSERQRVSINAAKRALIPAVLLLLVAALYRQIGRGVASAGLSYVRWVKGSQAPGEDSQ